MNFEIKYVLGFILSFAIVMIVMPFYIKTLKKYQLNQSVSEYALEEYKNKAKTPVMGGLLFMVAAIIGFVLTNINGALNPEIDFVILSVISFGFIGTLDDIFIITKHNNEGLSPKTKLIMELIFTVILYFLYQDKLHFGGIEIPFTNTVVYLNSFIFLPLIVLIYAAEANAVNFTDGMDGLCAGVSAIGLIPFAIFAIKMSDTYILAFILCFIGALIGYLYYNFHPAKIFMGDSGSLALGALFSSLAIVLAKEIALFVVGGVFVFEMFCVCLQLSSVKLFHKRVFKYTPIHYAFVLKGKKEVNVVLMFYVLATILAILGTIIGLN